MQRLVLSDWQPLLDTDHWPLTATTASYYPWLCHMPGAVYTNATRGCGTSICLFEFDCRWVAGYAAIVYLWAWIWCHSREIKN